MTSTMTLKMMIRMFTKKWKRSSSASTDHLVKINKVIWIPVKVTNLAKKEKFIEPFVRADTLKKSVQTRCIVNLYS